MHSVPGHELHGARQVGRWPADELVDLSGRVDLIVLGSRAWGPVRRLMLGSVSARLTRAAHCPVLVLPRGAATGQPGEEEPKRTHMTVA
jgi:hypothetical protein